jgi:predicted transcriptional regulator of viral defense system
MKFESLYEKLYDQAWFDVESVKVLFSDETESSLRTSLYRFMREGKLASLRRGFHAFLPPYCKKEASGPTLANQLYYPSYLSERWALGWYGIIPEKVPMYTSLSPRGTREFSNNLGRFRYRKIQQKLFSGFRSVQISGEVVLVAEPEKALVDLWYLEPGEWTEDRLHSWRFSPGDISLSALHDWVQRFDSPKIFRTHEAWQAFVAGYDEGEVIE